MSSDYSKPFTSSTGVKITLKAAPSLLIEKAQASIQKPKPPKQKLEDGREVANELHPDYQEAIEEYQRKQVGIGLDTMVLFGVGLPEGLPEDEEWIKNLRYFEKLGHINLKQAHPTLDIDNPEDREFFYKRYVALGNDELTLLSQINGIRQEDVEAFTDSFQGPA